MLALTREYGISARLTLSNSLLRPEHLTDPDCNALCRLFQEQNDPQNGAIVHAELLTQYLKKNYPSLYLVSSTTKVLTDFNNLQRELARPEFRYVVPDFRLNRAFDRLAALPQSQKDKVEFLCNECCWFGCTERRACYEAVSRKNLGSPRIIAEDLGFLTEDVTALLKQCGYPGMKVLEFAFDSRDGGDYRPHSYPKNCIAYVGTHDNEPVNGWMETAAPEDVACAVRYLNLTKKEGYHWGMMRGIWSSAADLAVVQAQDLLGLGHESRMNTPSTLGGNWCWRAEPGVFNTRLAKKLHSEMELYGRLPE